MILIGETLNSSIPHVREAIEEKNKDLILEIIKNQDHADYLDVNTALTSNEASYMSWLVDLILKHTKQGIMIDSPNPAIVEDILKKIDNRPVILNSISLIDRHEYIDYALKYRTGIVALPIGRKMPETIEERVDNSAKLISSLIEKGISEKDIYLDILVEALATNDMSGKIALETMVRVKEKFKDVKTIAGLSNISFGLPKRQLINNCFLSSAIFKGLDAGILNVTSRASLDVIYASLAIKGDDEYCLDYINYIRDGE